MPESLARPIDFARVRCGAHGDIISWIEAWQELSFSEAVKHIAQDLGVWSTPGKPPRPGDVVPLPGLEWLGVQIEREAHETLARLDAEAEGTHFEYDGESGG